MFSDQDCRLLTRIRKGVTRDLGKKPLILKFLALFKVHGIYDSFQT